MCLLCSLTLASKVIYTFCRLIYMTVGLLYNQDDILAMATVVKSTHPMQSND